MRHTALITIALLAILAACADDITAPCQVVNGNCQELCEASTIDGECDVFCFVLASAEMCTAEREAFASCFDGSAERQSLGDCYIARQDEYGAAEILVGLGRVER